MAKAETEDNFQYDAFISYSRKDRTFAEALEKALEDYKAPKELEAPRQNLNIFRDEGDLTGTEYFRSIEEHLKNSSKLIVVCSPRARESIYVNDEIRRFAKARGAENIIPILLEGIPNNEAKQAQRDEMAFPEALCEVMELPLATDYLGFSSGQHKIRRGRFEGSWYTILSNLYSVSRVEIEQRDRKRQARRRRIAGAITFAVMVALLGLTIWALKERQIAIFRQLEAERQARISTAGRLAAESMVIGEEFPQRSVLLATEAMHATMKNGEPPVKTAEQALRDALSSSGGTIIRGSKGPITAVAFSPDGRLVATGERDGIVSIWDLSTLSKPPMILRGDQDPIYVMAISADSRWLVTDGPTYGVFRVWNLNAPAEQSTILPRPDFPVIAFGLANIAISMNSRWLVTAGTGNVACVWDLTNLDKPPLVLSGHLDIINWIAISPDSRRLITASRDDEIVRVWDLDDLDKTPILLSGHRSGVNGVKLNSDNGHKLVTVDRANKIRVWDFEDLSNPPVVFPVQKGFFGSITISPDGQNLAVATDHPSDEPIVRVWDLIAEKPGESYIDLRRPGERVLALAMSRDSKSLLSTGLDGIIRVWNLDQLNKPPFMLRGHEGQIRAIAMGSDEQHLVTVGVNGIARLWDLAGPTAMPTVLHGNGNSITQMSIDSQSQLLAASDRSGITRVWNLNALSKPPVVFRAHEGEVFDMALAPNGRWLVTGSRYPEPGVRVWDLTAADPTTTAVVPQGQEKRIGRLKISPDNERLFSISDDRAVRIWQLGDLDKPPVTLSFPRNEGVSTMAASPNGRWLVTAHYDTTIRIWDVTAEQPGQELHVLDGYKSVVQKLVFSPNGRWLMTEAGKEDPAVRVWDLAAEDPAQTRTILEKGFEGYVYGTGFTPDSRRLVYAGQDRLIRVWDLAAGDSAQPLAILRGHQAGIRGFAISADGRRLVTGDEDGIVHIWDLHDLGAQPLTLTRHEDGVSRLAISPDGRRLVTADGTGRLLVWILPAEELISLAGRTAGRNLSLPEFNQYFSEQTYRKTFPNLPVPDNEYYNRVSGGQTSYYGVRVAD